MKTRLAKARKPARGALFLAASSKSARLEHVTSAVSQKPERDRRTVVLRRGLHLPATPAGPPPTFHLIDTTMMYAPRSGGVKRYLTAKRTWLSANRTDIRHTLIVPGAHTRAENNGIVARLAVHPPHAMQRHRSRLRHRQDHYRQHYAGDYRPRHCGPGEPGATTEPA